jgi:hypothetical protein
MKKLLLLFILLPFLVIAQLPIGTTRQTVTADGNGNIISTPLAYSNQFHVYVTSSNVAEVVVFQQLTNSLFQATNQIAKVKFGGTGNNTTLLTGSWTNSINFTSTGTNSANAYSVHGILGFSGNVTNMVGTGLTNVTCYSDGIVTNRIVIP